MVGRRPVPAVFHSATPAWGNHNLHALAAEVSSPLFLAHVWAAPVWNGWRGTRSALRVVQTMTVSTCRAAAQLLTALGVWSESETMRDTPRRMARAHAGAVRAPGRSTR